MKFSSLLASTHRRCLNADALGTALFILVALAGKIGALGLPWKFPIALLFCRSWSGDRLRRDAQSKPHTGRNRASHQEP
jgi:hypothetical protein